MSPLLPVRQERARTSNVTLARPKTAFATGFNWKQSRTAVLHGGGLTSAKTAPYLITLPTRLSVRASIIGEYFSNNFSSSLSDSLRDSDYTTVVSRLRYEVAKRQTVEFVENRICREKVCFPMTTTSAILIRYEQPGWGSRLTWHHEFVCFGGPINIKKIFNIDLFDNLFLPCPWQMIALHLNPHADLGCWRNLSSYAQFSVIIRCEETRDIQEFRWCPNPGVCCP